MLFADAGWIENLLREISLFLCQIVYKFMVYLYELFEVVGTADVITSDSINVVYTRIGLILGIYMMFRVILAFIQMLINPDNISDKEKGVGNLAKKAIIVVALMGVTPYIFEKAFDIQNFIVGVDSKSNVIAKIVFPEKVVSSGSFGRSLSAYLFTSFYRYDDQYTGNDCPLLHQQGDTTLLYNTIVANGGSVGVARLCLNDDEGFTVYDEDGKSQGKYSSTFTVGGDDSLEYYKIDFTWNGIFAFLVGGFTCYVLLTYTLYVGARVIQLAFFRIIAPMAILSYLSPKKDTMFEKWIKMCGTTYVDLFIRMAIIYFVVFAIDLIMGSGNGIALTREYDHEWIVNIVMIVALLLFAKKAPELLKELFPSSGVGSLGFGFKSPKNLFNDMLGGNLLSKGYDKAIGYTKKGAKWGAKAATLGVGAGLVGGTMSAVSRYRANKNNGKSGRETAMGTLGGFGSGFFRGVRTGAAKGNIFTNASKGFKDQRTADDKYDQLITSGGSIPGKYKSTLSSFFGETEGQTYTRQLHNMDVLAGYKKDMQDFADEVGIVKSAKDAWSSMVQRTGETTEEFQARKETARKRYKAYQKAVIDASIAERYDANGNLMITGTYKDEKGKEQIINLKLDKIDDADDMNQAFAIKTKREEANSFVGNHHVEVWNGTEYERVESINDRVGLEGVVSKANATKTYIYSGKENYHEAIANDKAAGVDSNATVNK